MVKHTPGPWEETDGEIFGIDPDTKEGILIADVSPGYGALTEFDIANAKLIAAAPEMLTALLECEVLLNDYPFVRRMVKEAIQKATS